MTRRYIPQLALALASLFCGLAPIFGSDCTSAVLAELSGSGASAAMTMARTLRDRYKDDPANVETTLAMLSSLRQQLFASIENGASLDEIVQAYVGLQEKFLPLDGETDERRDFILKDQQSHIRGQLFDLDSALFIPRLNGQFRNSLFKPQVFSIETGDQARSSMQADGFAVGELYNRGDAASRVVSLMNLRERILAYNQAKGRGLFVGIHDLKWHIPHTGEPSLDAMKVSMQRETGLMDFIDDEMQALFEFLLLADRQSQNLFPDGRRRKVIRSHLIFHSGLDIVDGAHHDFFDFDRDFRSLAIAYGGLPEIIDWDNQIFYHGTGPAVVAFDFRREIMHRVTTYHGARFGVMLDYEKLSDKKLTDEKVAQ